MRQLKIWDMAIKTTLTIISHLYKGRALSITHSLTQPANHLPPKEASQQEFGKPHSHQQQKDCARYPHRFRSARGHRTGHAVSRGHKARCDRAERIGLCTKPGRVSCKRQHKEKVNARSRRVLDFAVPHRRRCRW